MNWTGLFSRSRLVTSVALSLLLVSGCSIGPTLIPAAERKPVDRSYIESPNGFDIKLVARNLTCPTAIALVHEDGEYKNAILVAESGAGCFSPRIYGWKADNTPFTVYPRPRRFPYFGLIHTGPVIYGPIGGMVVSQGKIFITHRAKDGSGVVSSLTFNGKVTTLEADLPAEGDYGLTDIAIHPTTGRIWFGIGSATNSGVVGLDNFLDGWVRHFPQFCDLVPQNIKLLGLKFFTKNPTAGFFGENNAGTGPYQPFGTNNKLRIYKTYNDKPTSSIFSISPLGGDLKVEAWGIHLPRGLGFDEYSVPFATNDGMELRGTRPIKNDPDSLIKIFEKTWYGFPDYTTDFNPVSDSTYWPAEDMIERNGGYPEITALVDQAASGLSNPTTLKSSLLAGSLPTLSGAAKFDFTPNTPTFRDYSNSVILALSGDRAPFATSGLELGRPGGFKVVRIDLGTKRVEDFVRNTRQLPASKLGNTEGLERPIDVKFGLDGKLYILDFGPMQLHDGKEKLHSRSGRIFVLDPINPPTR